MTLGDGEYRLSCVLRAHEDDVRRICVCGDSGIATSSRDKTVRFWVPDPEKKHGFVLSKTLAGHTSFVGPLAWIPPGGQLPEGGVVSGGMDTLVLLWDLARGEIMEKMTGHQFQVTGLAIDDNGDIISSSIDCTIRRWRKGHAVEFWEAHKVAVQAVLKLSTGSSDSTLKLWRGRTCLHTFVGHADTVRGLAFMPGYGILSASHDGTIKLWALTGQILMEMIGHTSLVYSVDAHLSGIVASGSEDCFLKIWRDGTCLQSIEHPGCVWDVKFLKNGDIVTACSDGTVRIWTLHSDSICDPPELEAFGLELSQYKTSRKKVGGYNLMDLPGLEALQVPGTKDRQTKVIREGDNGVAYSWNSKEYKWDKIGEIVDGPGEGASNQVLDGTHYDYVFDVDIGDGEPIRKLPYNRTDNPYTVADKWLLQESLPVSYRQQIVDFILQNTGQRDFSFDPSFRDPYTGSNAYVPGESSISQGVRTAPSFKHIPKVGMLFFDSAQLDGILKKISEFNSALVTDVEKSLSLSELELSRLAAIVKVLKDTSHYHCSSFADADILLLLKLLKSWPIPMLFPDVLMEILVKATTAPPQTANLLTIVRAITNLFKHSCFSNWLQSHYSEVLDTLSSCRSFFNKNAHLCYATLILNYAVLLIEAKDREGQAQVLSAALEIAEDGNQDVDGRFRALVAVGTLMLKGVVKSIAIDFDVVNIAKDAKGSKESKVAEVGADIELFFFFVLNPSVVQTTKCEF
ncbi:PUL domain [Musa troglodytarum]|uniref:PUL domain n=1 Tax=Musa troglodytarum TaxID=320322 RepID=A0A9E7FXM1_9LILI|nr:PUL domain [Musa troglodytarum]